MLILKKYNDLIETYLKEKYHPKVFNKHYNYYLEFIDFLFKKFAQEYSLKNYYLLEKCGDELKRDYHFTKIELHDFEIDSVKIREIFRRRIDKKFLNNVHPEFKKKKDVYVVDVIKKDLIKLNILVVENNKKPVGWDGEEGFKFFVKSQYSLNFFPNNIYTQNPFEPEEKFEFEHVGVFESKLGIDWNFELEELMIMSRTHPPADFLRNYYKLIRLNEEGYSITTIEEETGRKHHNMTQMNSDFRALIKCKNGNLTVNYDLKSSFPFWLAVLTKNHTLYNDIKSGWFKKNINKKMFLTWLNSKNYYKDRYKKINEYMLIRYDIDTSKLRDEDGCMYTVLAKLESDYVQGISNKLKVDNYTVHDQIYMDYKGEKEFLELVRLANKRVRFDPIWVRNK